MHRGSGALEHLGHPAPLDRDGQSVNTVGHRMGRLTVSIENRDATWVVLGEPLDRRPTGTAAAAVTTTIRS